MLQFDKSHNGVKMEVALGESFEVRLPENATTGYRWHLRSSLAPIIAVEEDAFQPPDGAVGAGGSHCWRFRTVQAGVVTLELEHRRSWEQKAAEVVTITIQVNTV